MMLKQSILVSAFVLLTALPSLAQIPHAAEFNRTFTHHTATVNNVRLHYVMGGRGEPIVLLHGFAESWRSITPLSFPICEVREIPTNPPLATISGRWRKTLTNWCGSLGINVFSSSGMTSV